MRIINALPASLPTGGSEGLCIDSPILLGIAHEACHKVSQTEDRLSADHLHEALISVAFSAAAFEGFLNGVAELGRLMPSLAAAPENRRAMAAFDVLAAAENSRLQPTTKCQLFSIACGGEAWRPGEAPLQDLGLLFELRNSLVHMKPLDRFERVDPLPAPVTHKPAKILEKLRSRNIVPPPQENLSWMMHVGTRAVAEWAFSTSVGTMKAAIEILPASHVKHVIEATYPQLFVASPPDLTVDG